MADIYPGDQVLEEARQQGDKQRIADLLGRRFWQSLAQERIDDIISDSREASALWEELADYEAIFNLLLGVSGFVAMAGEIDTVYEFFYRAEAALEKIDESTLEPLADEKFVQYTPEGIQTLYEVPNVSPLEQRRHKLQHLRRFFEQFR